MRKLEEIEKKWVLGEFDYEEVAVDAYAIKFDNFLDTLTSLRKPGHVFCDFCLILISLILVTLILQLLKGKGYIDSYHITNLPT